ncbi:MAG: arylsulfotransferase family protein [Chloroflexota bacterium]
MSTKLFQSNRPGLAFSQNLLRLGLSLPLFFLLLFLISAPSLAKEQPLYLSPQPNSRFVSTTAPILIRYHQPVDPATIQNKISVVGEQSGPYIGHTKVTLDAQTIIFQPDKPFLTDETVTVEIKKGLIAQNGKSLANKTFQFHTASVTPEDQIALRFGQTEPLSFSHSNQTSLTPQQINPPARPSKTSVNYHTLPDGYPDMYVNVNQEGKEEGYLFISNFTVDWTSMSFSRSNPYILILDEDGEPVFHQAMDRPTADFKAHDSGLLSYYRFGSGEFTIMNAQYEIVDTWTGIGYGADVHELLIRPNGNYIIMIYDPQPVDMSKIIEGGNPNAIVTGMILQEIDADKNLVFEWRSWDHIPITDTNVDLFADTIDYVHGNSIEVDTDGNWIISSRHLDEITKINRQTGNIIWRFGGKGNQFTFNPDDGEPFFEQHDARRLDNGNLMLFDNRINREYARAVEYELDEVNLIARRVWEYREPFPNGSLAMGSARRLPNGNTLIGWGSMYPSVSEVNSEGEVLFELNFQEHNDEEVFITTNSYRAFKLPWAGRPTWPPTLVEEITNDPDEVTIHYSWNGATDVQRYNIYVGESVENMIFVDSETVTGFETTTVFNKSDRNCYVQVEAIDNDEDETVLMRSNILTARHCLARNLFVPFMQEE